MKYNEYQKQSISAFFNNYFEISAFWKYFLWTSYAFFTHLNSAQKDPDRVAATYGVGILFQIRGKAFVIKALNNLHALRIIKGKIIKKWIDIKKNEYQQDWKVFQSHNLRNGWQVFSFMTAWWQYMILYWP
jgi:hypothetical protein